MYGNGSGGVSKESNSKGPKDFDTQQCYPEGPGQTKEANKVQELSARIHDGDVRPPDFDACQCYNKTIGV